MFRSKYYPKHGRCLTSALVIRNSLLVTKQQRMVVFYCIYTWSSQRLDHQDIYAIMSDAVHLDIYAIMSTRRQPNTHRCCKITTHSPTTTGLPLTTTDTCDLTSLRLDAVASDYGQVAGGVGCLIERKSLLTITTSDSLRFLMWTLRKCNVTLSFHLTLSIGSH